MHIYICYIKFININIFYNGIFFLYKNNKVSENTLF